MELISLTNEELLEQHKHYSKQVVIYKTRQNSLKILANSCYGGIGNPHFRFFQKDIAEGITLTGQTLLKIVRPTIDKYFKDRYNQDNASIYMDTDSCYYSMKYVVNKHVPIGTAKDTIVTFLDKYHKKNIQPLMIQSTELIHTKFNAYLPRLKFVRDVIADVGIFLAKKRYVLQALDIEGTRTSDKDKLKMMGIDSVKSSTPKYCREKIKQSIEKILNSPQEEFIDYIELTKKEFMQLPIEDIASPRGINDIQKYTESSITIDSFGGDEDDSSITYKSRAPMHVKASIYHNKLVIEKNMTNKYQLIENGDKIKFTYLKMPNPIKNNAIAFDGKLPKEFGLEQYVDYETQWEKTFLNSVKAITDVISWKIEQDNSMF